MGKSLGISELIFKIARKGKRANMEKRPCETVSLFIGIGKYS